MVIETTNSGCAKVLYALKSLSLGIGLFFLLLLQPVCVLKVQFHLLCHRHYLRRSANPRKSEWPFRSNILLLIPAARPSSNPKTANRPLISEATSNIGT